MVVCEKTGGLKAARSIQRNLSSDCVMCNGTGKVLDAQSEFYLRLLKWYADSGGKVS